MRKIIVSLVTVLSLLALAGCQPTASAPRGTPAVTPRPTISPTLAPFPTPAPAPLSLYALSNNTVVALNPADGSTRWQQPLTLAGGETVDTLLAVQDTVFIQTNQTLIALNASDGKERWRSSSAGRFLTAANGIALTNFGATLTALSTADGKQLWSFSIGQGGGSASIVGDVVYATNNWLPNSTLYALNLRDGKQRWSFQQPATISIQAITQDSVYGTTEAPGSTAITLFALNQSDGQERWHLPSPNTDAFWGVTEVSGVVYVALNGHNNNGCGTSPITYSPGTLYALSASDGKTLWQSQPPQVGLAFAKPVVDQGILYSADEQSGYAFNTADGQQLWSSQILQSSDAHSTQIAQPIISGSLVYLSVGFCDLTQTVPVSFWALDKSDGHIVWQYQGSQRFDDRADPLVLNGVVYVTTAAGGVEALNGSDGTQLWQNPAYLTHLTSNAD